MNVLKGLENICEGNLEGLQHDLCYPAVHYMTCTHYQCCFRIKRWIKNGKDETEGNEILLNYTCQVGVQHSHITIIQGAVIRRNLHKQTNIEYLSNINPLNRPDTRVIKQFVACYKNTKENILNYQWFSINIYCNHCINLGILLCLSDTLVLSVSQDGCTKF